jgi:hypothetical protein
MCLYYFFIKGKIKSALKLRRQSAYKFTLALESTFQMRTRRIILTLDQTLKKVGYNIMRYYRSSP